MTEGSPAAAEHAPDRSLLFIGGGIAVLVVAAVIAVVLLGSREAPASGK